MRRQLTLVAWLAILCVTPTMAAETAEEAAARQEAEENYRRINARVDDLFAAIESMQKRFSAMQDEMRKLNEEVARATERFKDPSTQENFKNLKKAIEEVDKNRRTDRDNMLEAFADLKKEIIAAASAAKANPTAKASKNTRTQSPKNGGPAPPAAPEKGYEYEVQEGDTLTKIVAALNKQGIKLTSKQIADANPSVNWNRLPIGHKIFIPAP